MKAANVKLYFAVAFIAIASTGARANLVQNCNFNEGRAVESARLVQGDTMGAWIVDRGSVDIVSRSWTPRHHLLWDGVSGPFSIDMGGSLPCPRRDGCIHQDLATVPGQVYQLKFALAGNFYGPPAVKTLVVRWGDAFSKTFSFDTTGRATDSMGWTYCTVNLRATSETTRLTFDNPINTSYGPVIDDISVEPVSGGEKIGAPSIAAAENIFNIGFRSVENERYQIQWSSSLANPKWQNFGDPLQGNGDLMSVRDAPTDSQKFYRVLILQ
jgi:choice-of-anchor C domain-containing protein